MGSKLVALIGKGISAGGRAIETRRLRKATGIEVRDPADFKRMVAEEVADSSNLIIHPTKKTVRLTVSSRRPGVEVDQADLKEKSTDEGAEEAADEVADASGVILQPTKLTSKLQRALVEPGLNYKEVSDLQKKLKTSPVEVRPDFGPALKTFVAKLKKLGLEYELIEGGGDRVMTRAEEPASDDGEKENVRTGTEVRPATHSQLGVLVAKLKKLDIEYELMHDRDMSRPDHFDVVVTVPAEVLTALREKKAQELKDKLGLEKSEVRHAQSLVRDWEVKPEEPSVVAAAILEKFAEETKVLMEKLGARAELVPATQGNSDEGQTEIDTGDKAQTETDTGEPPEDKASHPPQARSLHRIPQ